MNLPSIIAGKLPMKRQQKTQFNSPSIQDLGKAGEFGLGIQVFKIQSQKNVVSTDPMNKRKMMKNIQNPVISRPPIAKRTRVLPSLDNTVKQHKVMPSTQKLSMSVAKKVNQTANEIKPSSSASFSKAISQSKTSNNKTVKPQHRQENSNENQRIYTHNQQPFNQILNFYIQFDKVDQERKRQLKKLKKMKPQERTQSMQNRLDWVSHDQNIITDIVMDQQLDLFSQEEYYQQNPIEQYHFNKGFNALNYSEQLPTIQ